MDPQTMSIEHAFPSGAISLVGTRERYGHGNSPHSIFVWWARRPFTVIASIVKACLGHSSGEDYETPKRVLDPFAGGGTIPVEVASSGAEAYAVENNQLAYFILRSLLQYSQTHPQLAEIVETQGRRVLERLRASTRELFPARDNPHGATLAYFWSRSVACPACSAPLSLQKRPWLAKKQNKSVYIKRTPDHRECRYTLAIEADGVPPSSANAWHKSEVVCPFCGEVISKAGLPGTLEEYGFEELTAYCTKSGDGKRYFPATDLAELYPNEEFIEEHILSDLTALGEEMPDVPLPKWSGVVNPSLYGMHQITDLMNRRQLAVMVKLCRLLREEHYRLAGDVGPDVAIAVSAFLSGLVDQLADWNCRLCMWIPQNEQVGRALCGPGLPMMWDYVETDPLQGGPANLWGKLKRIVRGISDIPRFSVRPTVARGDARSLAFPDDYFDMVITDPPYYDNLFYSVLADCIYVWKRVALKEMLPDVFEDSQTDSHSELTACRHRLGSASEAHSHYAQGLRRALTEIRRVLKPNGLVSLLFAHSSLDGWASLLDAWRLSGLVLVAAWPIQVERAHRPRSMRSPGAVATSFVLVGKKHLQANSGRVDWSVLRDRVGSLTLNHSSSHDSAWSLFGKAIVAYSQSGDCYDSGNPVSTKETIRRLVDIVGEIRPDFTMADRGASD